MINIIKSLALPKSLSGDHSAGKRQAERSASKTDRHEQRVDVTDSRNRCPQQLLSGETNRFPSGDPKIN
jgi:hypothetical protein